LPGADSNGNSSASKTRSALTIAPLSPRGGEVYNSRTVRSRCTSRTSCGSMRCTEVAPRQSPFCVPMTLFARNNYGGNAIALTHKFATIILAACLSDACLSEARPPGSLAVCQDITFGCTQGGGEQQHHLFLFSFSRFSHFSHRNIFSIVVGKSQKQQQTNYRFFFLQVSSLFSGKSFLFSPPHWLYHTSAPKPVQISGFVNLGGFFFAKIWIMNI